MKDRHTLWIHCARKHLDLNPELIRLSDGNVRLLLSQKRRVSDDKLHPSKSILEMSCLLYCHDVRLNQLAAIKPPNSVNLPKRVYYDSVFKVAQSDAVWLVDVDSDDEARDHISSLKDTDAEINDFTDVTPGQKRFMKLWNHFLAHRSDGVTLAPKQLPSLCVDFARYFAQFSTCDDDEKQFICCLFNFMDENYLGALQAEEIIAVYRCARKISLQENAPEAEFSSLSLPTRSASKQSSNVEYNDSYAADESESQISLESDHENFLSKNRESKETNA
ncbi:hypothetical protein FisN_2Lh427 [Fistulifera solaris]|uniref:Polycomb protein VEFS-Box domain-containing protein n=1 Tax=Fistulifera solaris TaxID=1519565 RepID=A0A1Z5JPA4_FISSO|nr:hypothetical protein FisN_2Lh427 [Fistulifera solaris]|eukprot:GAX15847.1 hypothetical protein FisN_2Lh427 [Fistulifera solaris]